MDSSLYFGQIHIVEWLPAGELRTGWSLFNELEPMGLSSNPRVDVSFVRIQDREEFIETLRKISADFSSSGMLPLLHIETHGSLAGIGPTENDGLTWPELMSHLIPLNQLTGLRLWVVLAACEGIWGLKMAQPVERAAFLALLGPNRTIKAGQLEVAVQRFYRTLFVDGNGDAAIDAMNATLLPEPAAFGIVNVESLFSQVWQSYLVEECTEPRLSQRVEAIVAGNVSRYRAERGIEMPAEGIAEVRTLARRHIEAVNEQFSQCRRHFFFADLYPQNEERFPVTIESCRTAG